MALPLPLHIASLTEKLRYQYNRLVHYRVCPFGPEYQEAWNHRYELFFKFDRGIQTDAVGLYSVTPEKTAQEIARRVKGKTIVDAFCGIGGNALAFAEVCTHVYTVDLDEARLAMARHNAAVYRRSNITFINDDIFNQMAKFKADAIFLDPPWGGPSYEEKAVFTLADFTPSGERLLDQSFCYFRSVILRVPAQFNLAGLAGYPSYYIQPNLLHGRTISQTIYFAHA